MHLVLVLPLLMLSFGECADVNQTQSRIAGPIPSVISVTNGEPWGAWGNTEMCPAGTYATGFSLKVESYQGFWKDDTALNAIALHCSKPLTSTVVWDYTTIRSSVGSCGSWTQNIWCPSGVLKSFQLKVESYQGWYSDDTAVNNIKFKCTKGQVLEGQGMHFGTWSPFSSDCGGTGICGIKTRVQSPQGILDDSSLNDVTFVCCK